MILSHYKIFKYLYNFIEQKVKVAHPFQESWCLLLVLLLWFYNTHVHIYMALKNIWDYTIETVLKHVLTIKYDLKIFFLYQYIEHCLMFHIKNEL